jgi:hypothetical protein
MSAKAAAKKDSGVTLKSLHVSAGDKPTVFKDDPKDRLKLSAKINKLKQDKAACFLQVSPELNLVIKGYDAEANEWIVQGTPQKLPAEGTIVLVVPPQSGG